MPKWCVVPKCSSDCKSRYEKWSIFKVPSNVEKRKKWETAIPGIASLKPTQYVCEKHFDQRFILRKWIKYDSNGQIIAENPYTNPRLDATAVPSIFNSNIDTGSQQSTQHQTLSESVNDQKTLVVLDETLNAIANIVSSESSMLNSDANVVFSESSTLNSADKIKPDVDFPTPVDCEIKMESLDIDFEDPSPLTEVNEMSGQQIENRILKVEDHNSTFDNSKLVSSDSSSSITKTSPVRKRSWVATEIAVGEGQMYSLIVTKTENNEKFPVIERSVTLQADKTLRYRVYGHLINAQQYKLPKATYDTKELQESLERFKNMGLCNGLGALNNVYHLLPDVAFKDCVDRWHANRCALITKSKRCEFCMKLTQAIQKRELRSEKRETLTRVSQASIQLIKGR